MQPCELCFCFHPYKIIFNLSITYENFSLFFDTNCSSKTQIVHYTTIVMNSQHIPHPCLYFRANLTSKGYSRLKDINSLS